MENSTEKKNKNVFVILLTYLRNVFVDFINSFRYNNMKASAILVAIPGIVIGFALNLHYPTVTNMSFITSQTVYRHTLAGGIDQSIGEVSAPGMPFDFSGVSIFLLMLLGILNIFFAINLSGKKNLGSVIGATVFTGLMIIISCLYTYAINYFIQIASEGFDIRKVIHLIEQADGSYLLDEANSPIVHVNFSTTATSYYNFSTNSGLSLFTIWLSNGLSVLGCVLGFIFYDRTYEKVDR